MKLSFTLMHLSLLVEAYIGAKSRFPDTPIKRESLAHLMTQGLVYFTDGANYRTTAYGSRKIKQLLLTMQLPGCGE